MHYEFSVLIAIVQLFTTGEVGNKAKAILARRVSHKRHGGKPVDAGSKLRKQKNPGKKERERAKKARRDELKRKRIDLKKKVKEDIRRARVERRKYRRQLTGLFRKAQQALMDDLARARDQVLKLKKELLQFRPEPAPRQPPHLAKWEGLLGAGNRIAMGDPLYLQRLVLDVDEVGNLILRDRVYHSYYFSLHAVFGKLRLTFAKNFTKTGTKLSSPPEMRLKRDEPFLRRFAEHILRGVGYPIKASNTANNVLGQLAREYPDAVYEEWKQYDGIKRVRIAEPPQKVVQPSKLEGVAGVNPLGEPVATGGVTAPTVDLEMLKRSGVEILPGGKVNISKLHTKTLAPAVTSGPKSGMRSIRRSRKVGKSVKKPRARKMVVVASFPVVDLKRGARIAKARKRTQPFWDMGNILQEFDVGMLNPKTTANRRERRAVNPVARSFSVNPLGQPPAGIVRPTADSTPSVNPLGEDARKSFGSVYTDIVQSIGEEYQKRASGSSSSEQISSNQPDRAEPLVESPAPAKLNVVYRHKTIPGFTITEAEYLRRCADPVHFPGAIEKFEKDEQRLGVG